MQTMTSRKLYGKLNSFMGTMRDGTARKMVEGQQALIDYLQTKLSIYEEKLAEATGKERPELTDADRARLARAAHGLNADQLERNEHTWSPKTFMDWYRELVADKYTHRTYPARRGRPAMDQETVDAIVRIGRDNSNWGYERIANFVHWLGYNVSFMTIKRILNEHGIFPTDGRTKSDIDQFYKAHENVLAACDFATYELLTENGLQREHILFFEDITTREVWCGDVRCNPDGDWMAQIARNQCDLWDGRLTDMTYLIHDRDPLFTGKFTDILESVGCRTKLIPPKTPEYNGYMESFIGSFKRECLNHLILTSEEQLRYVIREYLEYYNHERPHAGLGGRMIKPRPQDADGEIVCTERLGGLLKYYHRVRRAA